jgi:hypothetical protein
MVWKWISCRAVGQLPLRFHHRLTAAEVRTAETYLEVLDEHLQYGFGSESVMRRALSWPIISFRFWWQRMD